ALVNGWEAVLDEAPLAPQAIADFAQGRAALAGELAGRLGCDRASAEARARRWALADLSLHLAEPAGREQARNMALQESADQGPCERAMRPLAVLEKINLRASRIGSLRALASPLALLTAIRVGLIGR
ncbi:MAG: hypothetical protein ABIW31_04620, partial [Novosphingobium sp.]